MSTTTSSSQIKSPASKAPRLKSPQILRDLRGRLRSGLWQAGQKIESEHELARSFGVCRATMTKALKELEREGVLRSEHGKGRFVADVQGRSRTGIISLIFPRLETLTQATASQLIAGFRDEILRTPYHIKIVAINHHADASTHDAQSKLWMNVLDPASVDGAIIATREVPKEMSLELAQQIPVVWAGHTSIKPHISGVMYDLAGGAFDAAEHLLALGHRHLGLLTIPEEFTQGREQRDGSRLACRRMLDTGEARLTIGTAAHNSVTEGHRLGMELLGRSDRPTAVLCGSDDFALGLWQAAGELKLRVPEELSIVAWGDTIHPQQIPIPLTTVFADEHLVGKLAVGTLLEMMESPEGVQETQRVGTRLLVRESTRRR